MTAANPAARIRALEDERDALKARVAELEAKIRAYTSVPADPLPIHDAANHEPCPGCSPEAPR